MNAENAVIIRWTLNEHDAMSVLRLLGHEMERTQTLWQPYWQRLADNLQQAMQEAAMTCRHEKDRQPV